MNKVAIYARVSTKDGKQDYQRQIYDLTRIIKSEGYLDGQIEIFAEHVSGYKKKEARPELDRLINITENDPNYFDCIFTTEISRVGREPSETRRIVDRWSNLNIPLYIETIRQRTIDKDGNRNFIMSIILQVLMEIANNEAETFKKRSSSGIRSGVANGRAGGSRNYPYGYTKDEIKMLVIEPTEAEVVKRIFNLYREGKGIKVIAGRLNQDGIPTRSQITYKDEAKVMNFKNPKKASDIIWSDKQIHDMLKNTIYKGERNLKGEKFKAPAIISEEIFDECREIMETKTHRNYLTTYTYLLKNFIKCGCCGRNYYARFKPTLRGDKVYVCSSTLIKGERCKNRGINISLIESAIFNEMITSPTLLTYLQDTNSVKKEIESEIVHLENQLENYTKSLEKANKQKIKLVDLLLEETIDKATFKEREAQIVSDIENQSKRLKHIKSELVKNRKFVKNHDVSKATLEMLKESVNNRNELAAMIRQFISKIIINDLNSSISLATIYLKIGGVEHLTTLKLFLNKYSIRKRKHSYFPISKMFNDPAYKDNLLLVESSDILKEMQNELEYKNWIVIEQDNIIEIPIK